MVNSDLVDDLEVGPHVVARLAWGDGNTEAPMRNVAEPALGSRLDSRSGRPLRPLPRFRPDRSGLLMVLVDEDPGAARHRFVVIDPVSGARALVVHTESEPHGVVVDFVPDGAGGVYLLEYIPGNGDATNRLRGIDADGREIWSRTGQVDHRATEPAELRGLYVSLHRTTAGELWLVPRSTTGGLAAIDASTGRTLQIRPLDADVANPIISPDGYAYYGRLLDDAGGEPRPRLAMTDLACGETSYLDCGEVPLLNLAAVDTADRIYARTADGVVCIQPNGTIRARLRLAGAVVAPTGDRITVAQPVNRKEQLVPVVEFGTNGRRRRWLVPVDSTVAASGLVLVDVADGPVFAFQVGGSRRDPGQLLYLDPKGQPNRPMLVGDDAAAELFRSESRTDPALYMVGDQGAVYVPVSTPYGYWVLRWDPLPVP